jgi:hypothetical protein
MTHPWPRKWCSTEHGARNSSIWLDLHQQLSAVHREVFASCKIYLCHGPRPFSFPDVSRVFPFVLTLLREKSVLISGLFLPSCISSFRGDCQRTSTFTITANTCGLFALYCTRTSICFLSFTLRHFCIQRYTVGHFRLLPTLLIHPQPETAYFLRPTLSEQKLSHQGPRLTRDTRDKQPTRLRLGNFNHKVWRVENYYTNIPPVLRL